MIMTVEELRKFIETDETDEVLEAKLAGIESAIRAYTNNNFRERGTDIVADVAAGVFMSESLIPYDAGDTIQISGSLYNDGLFTVREVGNETFMVNEKTRDDIDQYITRVKYPQDVKMGVANMMVWETTNRAKAGIESESISRHTVNYINLDQWNSRLGYPSSLVMFLNPYMKARFGRGTKS